MPKNASIKKTLEAILTSQKFDELDQFKDQAKWNHFGKDDRHLLADLFLKRGIIDVKKDVKSAHDSFESALKLTAYDPYISIKIAEHWSKYGRWDDAIGVIKKVIEKEPLHKEAILELGSLHLKKGKFLKDEASLEQSKEIFESLYKKIPGLPPFFYHLWGQTYLHLSRFSEEPCDLASAIDKFNMASDIGVIDHHLSYDHGMALTELAERLCRVELVHEAASYFLKAVEINPHFHEGWVHMGMTAKLLYEQGEGDEFFEKAETAFLTAARLNSHSKSLWLSWGELLLKEGKIKRNNEILHLAVQKFERADSLFPGDRDIHCFLADALMVLGLLEERYELLKDAKEKIESCLRKKSDDPSVLFLYGTCIVHLGKYFLDENLIRQSFEKYEKALALRPNDARIWQSLAMAHYTLGEMTSDPIILEKSVQLFENATAATKTGVSEILNHWGVALMKLAETTGDLHHVQIAADKFEQAIAFHSHSRKDVNPDPEWYYNYGCALDYLGDFYQDPGFYEKSIQILSHVLAEFPTYTQARYNLALSLSHFGDAIGDAECLEQALTHFDILLSEDPEDEIILSDSGVTHLTLAEILQGAQVFQQSRHHYEEAEMKLIRACALGSNGAFYWLACLYSLNGNYPESLHFLEKAYNAGDLPPIEELKAEDWLSGVRETTSFKNFLQRIS